MLTRHMSVRIKIASEDVTKEISAKLISASYEDVMSGETDVVVVDEIVVDATYGKYVFCISGSDDGHPSAVVAFITGGVADQNAFFSGFLGGFGYV